MIETIPLYSSGVPLAFFFWGPVVVAILFALSGLWARSQGVDHVIESDWNGYSASDIEKVLTVYGEGRRLRYRRRVLPIDMVFAFCYAVVGGVIVYGLATRGVPLWIAALCGGGWLLGGLCDIAENLAIGKLIDKFPKVDAGDVAFASRATQAKLVLFLLGIVGALAAIYLVFRPLAA